MIVKNTFRLKYFMSYIELKLTQTLSYRSNDD